VFTGGGPVFPDTVTRLLSAGHGLRVVCVYGSTEAEPIAHLDNSDIGPGDLDAMRNGRGLLAGRPVREIGLRIVDDEIQVAGAHVNGGYLDPAHDAENKLREGGEIWHRTGDAGSLDADGRLWLLGRIGSEVTLDGRRVFPFSIEVAARGWDGVRQCALVEVSGAPCLVIEGDETMLEHWRDRASLLGIADVWALSPIPMDRRHASKVDRAELARRLG
jgi:acyl-CoA synthetase (AMP-forming)/AMP-acid ligase II